MKYFYALNLERRSFCYVLYDSDVVVEAALLDAAKNLKKMNYILDFELKEVPSNPVDKTLSLVGFVELESINIMIESILSFYGAKNKLDTSDYARIPNS